MGSAQMASTYGLISEPQLFGYCDRRAAASQTGES
jgi:hypothetical protein